MPSVKNPNKPSKNRLAARAAKVRKVRQKSSATGKRGAPSLDDQRHGAREGLLPTSGPKKPLSGKKAKKLEKKLGYALRRKMESEGVVGMDIESTTEKKDEEKKIEEEQTGMDIS
ncbi:ribosome biogenesis protein ALB1 [Podospora fimiseda]|uniref:Ribosome biogenesis protein ALB1 n=1 Tax=Podospora fimiseda TaxID=252190 RepID=A0AAN7BN11_9PEZI|nr:ribosome biogenesis protein ALB1 [Podospora fimiseda]